MSEYLTASVIVIAAIFDAWRDALIYRKADVAWLSWHFIKWVAYYLPLAYAWLQLPSPLRWYVVGLATLAWFVTRRAVLSRVGGKLV